MTTTARARAVARPAVPRLVVIVDEFRVLAEELPEFVSGLIRIATVGRSLGVHLVLATQPPAGVVSAEITANVNLRIGLRVRDDADSRDLIGVPAAALIPVDRPGRGFARVGAGPPDRLPDRPGLGRAGAHRAGQAAGPATERGPERHRTDARRSDPGRIRNPHQDGTRTTPNPGAAAGAG